MSSSSFSSGHLTVIHSEKTVHRHVAMKATTAVGYSWRRCITRATLRPLSFSFSGLNTKKFNAVTMFKNGKKKKYKTFSESAAKQSYPEIRLPKCNRYTTNDDRFARQNLCIVKWKTQIHTKKICCFDKTNSDWVDVCRWKRKFSFRSTYLL